MMFIAIKTKDGVIKGKLSFYCRMLGVSRQGFYKYLAIKDRPWKYQDLADAMRVIHAEDECNDTYGRIRMYQALLLKNPTGIKIPSERTVYRVIKLVRLVNNNYIRLDGNEKASGILTKGGSIIGSSTNAIVFHYKVEHEDGTVTYEDLSDQCVRNVKEAGFDCAFKHQVEKYRHKNLQGIYS